MGIGDILAKIAAKKIQNPQLYEVWNARVPPSKYAPNGAPMMHYVLVTSVPGLDKDHYLGLVITTKCDAFHAYELSEEQAASAGIGHGVFRLTNPHIVRREQFDQKMGCLTKRETLTIDSAIARRTILNPPKKRTKSTTRPPPARGNKRN